MEDHRDDGGENLSSLHDKAEDVLLRHPCDSDADDEFSDQDHDECMGLQCRGRLRAYPIDHAK
eukprot:6046438-Lingulodinium_polyedra.AAC.1